MEIINISNEEFDNLKKTHIGPLVSNNEASIFDFDKNNILKKINITDDKLYIIESLYKNKDLLPYSFIVPNAYVKMNDKIIGFLIKKINGSTLTEIIYNNNISNKQKLIILKKVGEVLNQLDNIRTFTSFKEIFINDLNDSNIMVNPKTNNINIIDLDSCKINNSIIFPAKYINSKIVKQIDDKYIFDNTNSFEKSIIPNKDTDLFCYHMIILKFLTKDTRINYTNQMFLEYINYLSSLKINKKLLDSFYRLFTDSPNENPLNYLKDLTDMQIEKASFNNFYKKIKM